ncbi:MAG: Mrp/NBP35 family ATP-binding protein [Kiritimatiellia bacterium]|nr:Mrp/NBP35 family ATP-binding protein [Kiritimatiellia bacterium]
MSDSCSHDCKSCGSDCADRKAPQSFLAELNKASKVSRVVAVASGKGGVGKSLTTALLAVMARRKGLRVGLLDADITGPSAPKIFGVKGPAVMTDEGVLPATTRTGIDLVSLNLLLPDETEPVIWRGPVIAGAVKQFWTDVVWKDIDVLFLDMPPGTGDVPLTVYQSIPVDAAVIVSTPQELVGQIVGKSVRMASKMNIPVKALVENMAYFECPGCHQRHPLFGESRLRQSAEQYAIPVTAGLPLDPNLAALCDQGKIEDFAGDWLDPVLETCLA